jgi:anti-anti-sigma factor
VIVARLTPAPLRLTLRAEPAQLRALRAAVADWTAAAGLGDDDAYDLQLALGEAAANAVEHAYRDGPAGTMTVKVTRDADGRVRASVRDEDRWRPEPADRGHRGRGLDMIREVSEDMRMRRGRTGTHVRFEIPPPSPHSPAPEPVAPDVSSVMEATRLRVTDVDGAPRVEVLGDLDIDAVDAVRGELLAATRGATGATVDLSATTYLASAGVALLVEAAAGSAHSRLRVITSGGVVRRMLALSGVDDVLDVDG